MEIVLLERVQHLGQMGDVVKVRDGYARNFLLPQKKALRATKDNLVQFEKTRAQLEARNLERRQEAEAVGVKLKGQSFIIVRSAGETGHLYGSVSGRDIADVVTAGGVSVSRGQISLERPIKTVGLHPVKVVLHAEVIVDITINVARSQDEAERQARGENVLAKDDAADEETVAAEEAPAAEETAA